MDPFPKKQKLPWIDTDFSPIENRIIGALISRNSDGSIHIKYIDAEEFYLGKTVDFAIIDELAEFEPIEKILFEKPVKQNGKDASYLNFDPTKQHRKPRRR
jgi:hypothetical protein